MRAEVGSYGDSLTLIPENDADRAWLRRWEKMDISTGGCAIRASGQIGVGNTVLHMTLAFHERGARKAKCK